MADSRTAQPEAPPHPGDGADQRRSARVNEPIQSVARAARLLVWLAANDEATVTEAAAAMGWPVATTHNLLRTLVAEGLVSKDAKKRYSMGVRVGDLSEAFLKKHAVHPALRDELERLASTTGETSHLVAWRGPEIHVVLSIHGARAAIAATAGRRGVARPPLAASKLLLAHSRPEWQEAFSGKRTLSEGSQQEAAVPVSAEFAAIRACGYAVEGEAGGAVSIAAPIVVRDRMVAAYAITTPAQRFASDKEGLVSAVKLAGTRAGKALRERARQSSPQ